MFVKSSNNPLLVGLQAMDRDITSIAPLVAGLMTAVGLPADPHAVRSYSTVLSQNTVAYEMPKSLALSLKDKIESTAVNPTEFRAQYDTLKAKNYPVDRLLTLMSRIMDDESLCTLIGASSEGANSTFNGAGSVSVGRHQGEGDVSVEGLPTPIFHMPSPSPSLSSFTPAGYRGERGRDTGAASTSRRTFMDETQDDVNIFSPLTMGGKHDNKYSTATTNNENTDVRDRGVDRSHIDTTAVPSTPQHLDKSAQKNRSSILSPTTWNMLDAVKGGSTVKSRNFNDNKDTNYANLTNTLSDVLSDHGAKKKAAPEEFAPMSPLSICYGMHVSLRNGSGSYMSLVSPPKEASRVAPVNVALCGNGVGDTMETLKLVNVNFREDKGPVKFGDIVAFSSPFAQGKYMASDPASDSVSFKRNAFGSNEKWMIVDVSNPSSGTDSGRIVQSCDKVGLKSTTGKYLAVVRQDSSNSTMIITRGENMFNKKSLLPSDKNEIWNITRCSAPFTPDWLREGRSTMNNIKFQQDEKDQENFANSRLKTNTGKPIPLNTYPVPLQEHMIMEELLYALLGIPGRYILLIENEAQERVFAIDDSTMDKSLAFLVCRILPLCDHYLCASAFVESHMRYEYGMCSHAFAAAGQTLLKEYTIMVAQLETQAREGRLTLQKMWFYIQPSLRTLEIVARCTIEAKGKIGGSLINALYHVSSLGGDEKALVLMNFILTKSCAPFFEMLQQWIYEGSINDPYDEFMVLQRKDLGKENLKEDFNAAYWDERYTIRAKHVPVFLKDLADQILSTGKYLNVVRECGRVINCPLAEPIDYTSRRRAFADKVEAAYKFASTLLLDLLMGEENLVARLKSLKQFFLLDQGDFFVYFCDVADDELRKDAGAIDTVRLESFLLQAIHNSVAGENKHSKDITCSLERYTLLQHLEAVHSAAAAAEDGASGDTLKIAPRMDIINPSIIDTSNARLKGFEAFTLNYQVKWPLSLVISRQALIKYQLLFRHIFCCKHVERQLSLTWLDHQTVKELDLGLVMGATFCLRHRMQHFMKNLVYYLLFEVLEPHWLTMINKLGEVSTVDEVLRHHNEFLDTCLKECLLTHRELLKILTKMMTTCMLFAEQIEGFMQSVKIDEEAMVKATHAPLTADGVKGKAPNRAEVRRTRIAVQTNHIRMAVSQPAYIRMIKKFQDNFDNMLEQFMVQLLDKSNLQFHSHLSNLCTRIDYNGFYTSYLALKEDTDTV